MFFNNFYKYFLIILTNVQETDKKFPIVFPAEILKWRLLLWTETAETTSCQKSQIYSEFFILYSNNI